MDQKSAIPKNLVAGASFMILAGLAFAIINVITQTVTGGLGFKPTSDAFWQYFIALIVSLPFIWRQGLGATVPVSAAAASSNRPAAPSRRY